jgi:hypothetical protein
VVTQLLVLIPSLLLVGMSQLKREVSSFSVTWLVLARMEVLGLSHMTVQLSLRYVSTSLKGFKLVDYTALKFGHETV